MTAELPRDRFEPAWWLPSGHLQTLWRKFSPAQEISHMRERLELPDGDFIDIDWAGDSRCYLDQDQPIVLLLHGLCGSSNSGYVRTLQTALTAFGIPNVAANFRGCSGELNRLARAYHSGVTEDLQSIFEYLQQQYPQHRFVVVGFSLGANVILKWLGERASPAAVRGAVAVSTPFSLAYCSQAMTGGLGQFYGRFFLRRLVAEAERKKLLFRERGLQQQLDSLQACGNLHRLMNLWEFDDRVTAPLHGFTGAEDYYQRCSSLQFLPAISTPTLLIQSLDDPIIPAGSLPRPDQLNNNIHVELCASGGHVGFISRTERHWLENRILRFIRELDQTSASD